MHSSAEREASRSTGKMPNLNGYARLSALEAHLSTIADLSDLPPPTRERLAQWLFANAPFRNLAQLESQLASSGIEGVKKPHRSAIAESFRTGISRRQFLSATIGIPSLASLAIGCWLFRQPPHALQVTEPASLRLQPLADAIRNQQQPLGRTLRRTVEQHGIAFPASSVGAKNWQNFAHSLDMSNWIEAATFLYDSGLLRELEPAAKDPVMQAVADLMSVLHRAWNYLVSQEAHWRDEFFIAYAFGKMPALAAPGPGARRFPGNDRTAQDSIQAIAVLAHLFQQLEILNQRYQPPGCSTGGAPVRFTQGHNFSYAHAAVDLSNPQLFSPARKTLLVNWDAHSDLGDPFANPRITLDNSFERWQQARSPDERFAIAGSMSIAGWIVALAYDGFFEREGTPAELVWIVPREAYETSHGAMENYGTYEMTIGQWKPSAATASSETEVRTFSPHRSLRSVDAVDVLTNRKTIIVHILDPDDDATIERTIGDSQIFLSGDVDYSGTREPGLRPRAGRLPEYLLNQNPEQQARHRQLIDQFAAFYQRFKNQIRSVSIANSPDFTVDEETRKPAAKLLNAVIGGQFADQPEWLAAEWDRVSTPFASDAPVLRRLLTVGGLGGLAALVGMLETHRRRVNEARELAAQSRSGLKSQSKS